MRNLCFLFLLTMICMVFVLLQVEAHGEEMSITFHRDEFKSYDISEWESGFINWQKLKELMDQLDKQIYRPPVNATLNAESEIIDGQAGAALDRTVFTGKFLEVFYKEEDGTIEIPKKAVHPRVEKEMLQQITRKRLGSYTTFYNHKNEERAMNIALSAEAIHGTVVFPGEIFSFNQTVGERTTEKGYKRAPVIVRGEFAEDIGGGICQVSSTLFNAVDLRGIQMVERYTHSRTVPYVPPGRDATVSWWGPDFSFRNLYNEPIVLTAKASYGSLTVEVFSSETVGYFKENE